GASLTVKVRRKIKRKAALMRVVGVPLPVKNQLTVNQTAKKVLLRKHIGLSMKVIRRILKRKQRGFPKREARPVPLIQSTLHQMKVLQDPNQNLTLKVTLSLENLEMLPLIRLVR
ncbi:hypothetical protein EK904_007229, partial [Melospiza melodia maxima]